MRADKKKHRKSDVAGRVKAKVGEFLAISSEKRWQADKPGSFVRKPARTVKLKVDDL